MQRTNLILLSFLLLAFLSQGFAQTKDNPIVTYLDYQHQPLPKPIGTSFIEIIWQDGDTWKAEVYDAADQRLREAFYYKHSDRKEKHGIYQAYYASGMSSDSGLYVNNKWEGIFMSWHENGQASGVFKYRNNIPIDTTVEFYDNGTKKAEQITDSMVNGFRKAYYGIGKTKAAGED
jgi:hypothetical protein